MNQQLLKIGLLMKGGQTVVASVGGVVYNYLLVISVIQIQNYTDHFAHKFL